MIAIAAAVFLGIVAAVRFLAWCEARAIRREKSAQIAAQARQAAEWAAIGARMLGAPQAVTAAPRGTIGALGSVAIVVTIMLAPFLFGIACAVFPAAP